MGYWPRHVVDGCFKIWDLAKPVIAQVHGYCLAGGTELAQSCDLIYVADDSPIGYPVVRNISPPDNQFYPWVVGMRKSMELMLTGNSMNGKEAVKCGFANQSSISWGEWSITTSPQEVNSFDDESNVENLRIEFLDLLSFQFLHPSNLLLHTF